MQNTVRPQDRLSLPRWGSAIVPTEDIDWKQSPVLLWCGQQCMRCSRENALMWQMIEIPWFFSITTTIFISQSLQFRSCQHSYHLSLQIETHSLWSKLHNYVCTHTHSHAVCTKIIICICNTFRHPQYAYTYAQRPLLLHATDNSACTYLSFIYTTKLLRL